MTLFLAAPLDEADDNTAVLVDPSRKTGVKQGKKAKSRNLRKT